MKFEYKEDQQFFEVLLCKDGQSINDYSKMFDFRNPPIKRAEFNKIKNHIMEVLISRHGSICMLDFDGICEIKSGLVIDHLIPLSTNKLNKDLRQMNSKKGKKVSSQSFGSNNIENFALACNNCNRFKKHKILDGKIIKKIFVKKSTS